MPGFSFLSTLLAGLGAWSGRRTSRRGLVIGFLIGAVVVWLGVASDLSVLTVVGLFGTSVTVGSLLGQSLSPRSRPVLLALIVLAGVDLAWIASGGGGAGEGWVKDVANVTIELGGRSSSIGTLDLVIAAALAAHWLTRGAAPWLAVAPGPVGMVFSNVFVALTGATNLALIPFLLLGWLITEGLERRLHTADRNTDPTRSPGDADSD